MDKEIESRRELLALTEDLGEWLQLLEEKGRDDGKFIWSNLNTKKVIKLVEELLKEFEEHLTSIEDKEDKKEFQKISKEVREALVYFRKEYKL
jgi:hypothetical protein